MIDDNETETLQEFGFKRSTIDKLTYKHIIADAINQCRRNRSYMHAFQASVEGLEEIIWFDVPGYPLKKELIQIQGELDSERGRKYVEEGRRRGRIFYKRAEQVKFRLRMHEWYWDSYFKEIIQLLAKYNLLLETQKYIPVRAKEGVYESEEVLHE